MFQRSVTDAALCLRCQIRFRIAQRVLIPTPLSHSARRRFHATAGTREDDPKSTIKDKSFTNRVEPLEIDTLGSPSQVLVLRSKRPHPGKRFQRLAEKEEEDRQLNSASEVLEEIDKERYRLGATEVSANFEYLRSLHQPGDSLFPINWDKLRDVLEHGFTLAQLSHYIKQYNATEEANAEAEDKSAVNRRPKWKAGTSLFLELGTQVQKKTSQRIERLRHMEGKVLLAEKIMRDCWQLTIRNEVGQVDLRVPSKYLSTLLISKLNPLKTLTELYNVKIDVTKALNLIRITGNEADSLQAYAAVEELVSKIRTMQVDLSKHGLMFGDGSDGKLEKSFIQELQTENGVFCRIIKTSKKFVCHYLDGTEANAEKVCKSICLATTLPRERPQGLVTYYPNNQPVNMYSVLNRDFMSFPDRHENWFRWAKPLLDIDIHGGRAARRPPAQIYKKDSAAPLSKISESLFADPKSNVKGINAFTNETITATLGKCLFQKDSKSKANEITFSAIETASPSRIFVPDVPNTWSYIKSLPSVDSHAAIHRIRLFPAPTNSADLPPIELELEVPHASGTQQFSASPVFRKATAILNENDVDMLLPEIALDLRFTKMLHYDILEGSPFSSTSKDHPVQSSLASCVARLQYSEPISGPQPRFPLLCKLAIPKKLITSSGTLTDGKNASEKLSEISTDFIQGEYVFPPFPSFVASRVARFNYKDLELSFSNPRTGPLLPRQSINVSLSVGRYEDELRPLIAAPKTSDSGDLAENNGGKTSLAPMFQPLYTRACQLAFELSATK